MREPIIEVEGLIKRYGQVQALAGVDFAVYPGRITVFMGENGAGKTTALKCILGFLRPDGGRVRIRAGQAGYIPEHPASFSWLTGREVLSLAGRAYGIGEKRLPGLVSSAAAKLSLDEGLLSRRVQTLSQGNQKKFSYLQNLIISPDLLIVDEPFSALDPVSIKGVRDLFLEIKDRGGTVFLSSHLLSEAEKIMDDVIIIKKGRVCFQSALEDSSESGRSDLESLFMFFAK